MSEGYEALTGAAGLVARSDAGVVVATGGDARSYLDRIVSQRTGDLEPGQGARSLLLQPAGKLQVAFRLLCVDGAAWWLDTEAGFGESLAEGLRRFLVRVDVEVEDRSGEMGVLSVRGPEAAGLVAAELGVDVPDAAHAHVPWGDARVVRADWPDVPGVDLVGPAEALEGARESLTGAGVVEASADDLEVLRVEVGIPRLGRELTEKTIAQEAFLDREAIDFDKGCFLGQELVCRINDRGRVNRLLRGVVVEGERPPEGADLLAGEKRVGALTSVVDSPRFGGPAGLGYVRREVEPGAPVILRWDGGEARAVVRELPLVT